MPRRPASHDGGERLAVVEAVTARIETRVEQVAERTHAQATAITALNGMVERIADTVERIEGNQGRNRDTASAEHAELKGELVGQIKALDTRVVDLERDRDRRLGAAALKHRLWGRLDAYAIALISLGGAICAAFIGLAPAVVQFLRGK